MILAVVSLVVLWYSNDFMDWMVYWMLAGVALLVCLMVFGEVWYLRRRERKASDGISAPGEVSIRSLRGLAMAGDNCFAPPIAVPYLDASAVQPLSDVMSLRVATPESRLLRGQQVMYGINLIFLAILSVFWVAIVVLGRTLDFSSLLPWQLPALYVVSIILHAQRFVMITRKTRAIRVEAHADGLHWGNNTLSWSEVRGWYVFAMNPASLSKPKPNIIYALVGEHASPTWLTYPPYARSGEPGQQLAQLVQAHVTMPLRDLLPGALHISSEIEGSPPAWRSRLLAIHARSFAEVILPRLPVAALGVALSALVLFAGIFTPNAQQWYFGGQLIRMETAASAVHDPLTANTLRWTPTTTDAASDFAFTVSGYQYLPTNCCNSSSLMTQPINDGLAEVTVHQQSKFDLSETGILFRANAASNSVLACVVTPNGEWHLNRFSLRGDEAEGDYRSLRYEGLFFGVGAIHQGPDATNRLAVLMEGSSCTFYVNGQYVGIYRADDLPQSGQVGVYADGLADSVTFSDLLILPA